VRCISPLTERQDGVADEPVGLRARRRKAEPVGKALHGGGFARGERAVLDGVNEHQRPCYPLGFDRAVPHASTPSTSLAVVMPSALASRTTFLMPGLRTPRSMSLR